MNLQKIRVKEITDIFYKYSKAGVKEEMNNRPSFGISFCESGKITYIQKDTKIVSTKNNVIVLPKGASYKIIRQESGFFPVINFECDEQICDTITSIDADCGKIMELFFELKECYIQNYTLESLSLFYKILSEIFELAPKDKFSQIKKYINGNLSDCSLSNKKIADALNISESYLNKLFIKHYGNSTKKYIIEKRLELAVRYLGENRYNISEICEKCGYSNPYSFSRAFKNAKNISPSVFKKTLHNR